jgi:hypothetical protein
MNGKDLERYIEANSPLGATALDHFGRKLRETGFLPIGGRGTSAPELTAQQVATYLLAAAVADKPADGAEAVATYKSATDVKPAIDAAVYNQLISSISSDVAVYNQLIPSDGKWWRYAGCETLGEALTVMLGRDDLVQNVRDVRICRSWPYAAITVFRDEKRTQTYEYGYATPRQAEEAGFKPFEMRFEAYLSGDFLRCLSMELTGLKV